MLSTRAAASPTVPQQAPHPSPARRVVIAVDDTPAARRTLASGIGHASAQGADVTVVQVVPARHWRVSRLGAAHTVPMRARDPQRSPLLREALGLAAENGVRARVELIASDDPDRVVLGLARREDAAEIVVGACSSEALTAPFRVCWGVLRRAPVPVVVVPA